MRARFLFHLGSLCESVRPQRSDMLLATANEYRHLWSDLFGVLNLLPLILAKRSAILPDYSALGALILSAEGLH